MTGLLVSVRDAAEARAAVEGGADLIDIKEPLRGSLGAADVATWQEVRAAVGAHRPISVALGELDDSDAMGRAMSAAGVAHAKVGLAGCVRQDDWPARWRELLRSLPNGVSPVAVVYADFESALAPDPETIIAEAKRLNCQTVLIDTFDKSQGGLFEQASMTQLGEWIASARDRDLRVVIGGSLDIEEFETVIRLWSPAFIAVRGAACDGPRTGRVSATRVRRLKDCLENVASASRTVLG